MRRREEGERQPSGSCDWWNKSLGSQRLVNINALQRHLVGYSVLIDAKVKANLGRNRSTNFYFALILMHLKVDGPPKVVGRNHTRESNSQRLFRHCLVLVFRSLLDLRQRNGIIEQVIQLLYASASKCQVIFNLVLVSRYACFKISLRACFLKMRKL